MFRVGQGPNGFSKTDFLESFVVGHGLKYLPVVDASDNSKILCLVLVFCRNAIFNFLINNTTPYAYVAFRWCLELDCHKQSVWQTLVPPITMEDESACKINIGEYADIKIHKDNFSEPCYKTNVTKILCPSYNFSGASWIPWNPITDSHQATNLFFTIFFPTHFSA